MNSHPPRPPNSEFFKLIDGILYFRVPALHSADSYWLEVFSPNLHPIWRPVISAVAYKACMDEAKKCPLITAPVVSMNATSLNDWHIKCLANADAWDAWGRKGCI